MMMQDIQKGLRTMDKNNIYMLEGEQALAEEMISMATLKLLEPDAQEYHHGLDTDEIKVAEGFKSLNARLFAAGEAELNTVPSSHRAELTWLNHMEPCAFPVTLAAKLLDSDQRSVRRLIAKRVRWLHLDLDGRLYGEYDHEIAKVCLAEFLESKRSISEDLGK